MKYLEISASVFATWVDFRRLLFSAGQVSDGVAISMGFVRRELRNDISEKARSGTEGRKGQ